MKKFACIFLFLIVSLSGFSHSWDTTSILKFNFNPTLIGQMEFGGTFEYHLKKYISFEAGGGARANGFTIRVGTRIYTESGFYFNPLFFYKNKFYNDREYSWNRDCKCSEILETRPILCFSGTDYRYSMIADERKQVTGVQMLFGWMFLTPIGISFDVYTGVGYRYKYRVLEISSTTSDGYPSGTTYHSPPIKETIDGYFPSIQGGFQIGFPLVRKKHSTSTAK